MKTLKKILWLAAVLLCIVSCSKEEVTEKVIEVPEGKVLVETEIVVDGVIQSKTRASSNAGYTTGDGLYDSGDKVIVAAVANEGYELAAFYDKKYPSTNLGTSYEFPAAEPRTFKAEFARKYTITVSASPTAGGTVSGGGTYRSGKPCTLTATPNAGYTFDGWYEGSTKLSSNTSYSFTVSSNRTITGKFELIKFIAVGANGYIISPTKTQQIITESWRDITYGNGKFVAVGNYYMASSSDGINWSCTSKYTGTIWESVMFENGLFLAVETVKKGAWTSVDGINWNTTSLSSYSIYGWGHGGGTFAITTSMGKALISTNGVNWTEKTLSTYVPTIAVSENCMIIYTTGGAGYKSTDGGNSWESSGYDNKLYPTKIIHGDGKFITANTQGIANSILGYIMEDGAFGIKPTSIDSSKKWIDVDFRNGKYAALSKDGYYAVSTDGINWSTPMQITDNSGKPVTANLNSICVMP